MKYLITLIVCLTMSVCAKAGTQYLATDTLMYYNASNQVVMGGGQTVTIDGLGRILNGRLSATNDQTLYYGSSLSTQFLKNSMISFSGGYVSDAYLWNTNDVLLNYGPSRFVSVIKNSHILFSGGYVSDCYLVATGSGQLLSIGSLYSASLLANSHATFSGGYLASGSMSGTSALLYYSPTGSVSVNCAAPASFVPGGDGKGYFSHGVLYNSSLVNYGPSGRMVSIRASGTFVTFVYPYVSQGIVDTSTVLTTASGPVGVSAGTLANFSGGYYTP